MLNVLAIMLVFFALGAIVLAHAAKQQEADCRKGSV